MPMLSKHCLFHLSILPTAVSLSLVLVNALQSHFEIQAFTWYANDYLLLTITWKCANCGKSLVFQLKWMVHQYFGKFSLWMWFYWSIFNLKAIPLIRIDSNAKSIGWFQFSVSKVQTSNWMCFVNSK